MSGVVIVTSSWQEELAGGSALFGDAGGVRRDAVVGAVNEGKASRGCHWRIEENAACAGR